jgi:hypothetical protein
MEKKHSVENSPESLDNEDKKTNINDSTHPRRLPKFDDDLGKVNGNKLHLPEEDKNNFEYGNGVFKIDFSNDPVLRSLLEAKQDQCALHLQRLYLSKKCKFLYIALAFICSGLVLWTLLDRQAWKENVWFIIIELTINIIIAIDIVFKIKLTGCKKYFKTCSNLFDFGVASG